METILRNSRCLCKHTNSTQEQDKTVFHVWISYILRDLSGRFDPVVKRILEGKHPRGTLRIPNVCLMDRICARMDKM